jgi:hypothetical protein
MDQITTMTEASPQQYARMMPMGSAFQDLFSGGKRVWPRILGTINAVLIPAVFYGR